MGLLPIIIALIVYSFWYIYRAFKKNAIEVGGKAISTVVILLFLVHPNIVQSMFFNFKCVDIDGFSRL